MNHPASFLFLGSPKCAGGVVLSENFMQGTEAKPLPKATPAPTSTSSGDSGTNYWPWLIGGAVAVGVVLVASGTVPLLANPHGDTVNDVVRRAGWSFDLAMEQLKSDGAARWHNDLLYVLTDSSGDTIPADPREPMIVGVYVLDEREGEWIEVGMKDFPDLRSALQHWNTVQVDMSTVRELRANPKTPKHFARSSTKRDEDDAREMFEALRDNAKQYELGRISYEQFDKISKTLWETANAAGIGDRVLRLWREAHVRSNPGTAQRRGFTKADADPDQLRRGIKHELEHTDSRKVAERIALDHLAEDPVYYTHLDAMERARKG